MREVANTEFLGGSIHDGKPMRHYLDLPGNLIFGTVEY